MSKDPLFPVSPCQLMIAGHGPHWIQAKISTRGPIYPVEIIGVEGNYVTFGNDEQVWTFWNHSEEELQNMLAYVRKHPDARIEFREKGTALCVGDRKSVRLYSLTSKPNGQCSTNPMHPDGFMIPGSTVDDPAVKELFKQVVENARKSASESEATEG